MHPVSSLFFLRCEMFPNPLALSVGWLMYINTKNSFLKIKMGGRDVGGFVTTDLEKLAAT